MYHVPSPHAARSICLPCGTRGHREGGAVFVEERTTTQWLSHQLRQGRQGKSVA